MPWTLLSTCFVESTLSPLKQCGAGKLRARWCGEPDCPDPAQFFWEHVPRSIKRDDPSTWVDPSRHPDWPEVRGHPPPFTYRSWLRAIDDGFVRHSPSLCQLIVSMRHPPTLHIPLMVACYRRRIREAFPLSASVCVDAPPVRIVRTSETGCTAWSFSPSLPLVSSTLAPELHGRADLTV